MNWEAIGVVVTVAGAVNYLMLQSVKQSISENNEKLKDWINGSFMRSATVQAKLDAIENRVEAIE